ncbi:MAG: hypothetical protein F4139_15755 [Gemmatimonadetes bacterium]|nr:hypothetical protein [Gemmatimonadota bacterium]MYB99286.1 hypothetical protein [Gemmatimonadota bacterium]MYH54369.1 hypothetical protein [Gemmatimonadota bacterium]MYI45887.1 hypothetical protein [Gemmatimonadota bacterium]MYK66359.1 hypothetical protein [Gemmatimonadota bacterium]
MFAGTGKRIRKGLPFLALLAAAGCVTTGGARDDRDREEIVIEVQNDNFNQATVYYPDGSSRRIGIVGGKSKATFRVEWYHPEVELSVRLLTGGSFRLRPRSGGRGEIWRFIIPANL